MTWPTFAPTIALTALSLALGWRPLPLHPAWSARLLLVTMVATALAAASTIVFTTAVFVAGFLPVHAVAAGAQGRLLLDHGPLPAHLGAAASALLATGSWAAARLGIRHRRDLRAVRQAPSQVTGQDRPMAIAVPGRDGGVLVSRGLMRLLDREQLRVVFRHERSHLRHRHHIFSALGALSAALFPPLAVTHRSLLLSLERWADEDAVTDTGDRALVARTLARVALADPLPGPGPHPAFTGSHIVHRVQALMGAPPPQNRFVGPALLSGTSVASSGMASSSLQLHHLSALMVL
ncbi:M56 family metallopeptidase [Nocardiopsis halophila]|uniref:M56 family metallopeptidase n=1 Tax=Nocardiopsis halophila TaxID=141692 RepID=UPI00034CD932|nr:M56 family metallopeptidase [Nocardiopsis halophila]